MNLNTTIWLFFVVYVTISLNLVSMENSQQWLAGRHRQFIFMVAHLAMVAVHPIDLISRVYRTHAH